MSMSTLRRVKAAENIDLSIEDSPYLLDNYNPVFILGCPRSGTTFLSTCIASIPNIEEFSFGNRFGGAAIFLVIG